MATSRSGALTQLALCFAALPAAHAADWIKLATPNFELYSTTTEDVAQQTLRTLERARDFFIRVNPTGLPPQLPVTVVQFRGVREYDPYRLHANAPAYMTGDDQRDFIVIGNVGEIGARATVHEFVHVMVKHSGLKIPRWLNEGMADVYSTLEERDGQIVVGAIPSYRTTALASNNWMRLSDLVAIEVTSDEDEAQRANMFYAESWLLAHMLILGEGYSDKFPDFLRRVSEDGSQKAINEVYGKSLAEMQAAMNAYFRGSSIGAKGFTASLHKAEVAPAQPAPEFEVEMALARLLGFMGKKDETAKRLDEISAKYGRLAEVEEARAYLALRDRDFTEGLRHLRAAIDLGATGWKTQWDYARILLGSGGARGAAIEALRAALAVKPDLDDARRLLDEVEREKTTVANSPDAEPLDPEPGDDPGARPVLRRGKRPAPAKR